MTSTFFMLYGYREKIDEYIEFLRSRYYPAPEFGKAKGIAMVEGQKVFSRPKIRELRFFSIDYLKEIEEPLKKDLAVACSAGFSGRETTSHPFSQGRMRFLRNLFTKFVKLTPCGKEWEVEPTPMPNAMLHGILIGTMPDKFEDGIEQI